MPQKESEAVPKGNGPIPRQEKFGPDKLTQADVYRLFEERFERQLQGGKSHLDKMDVSAEEMRGTRRRLGGRKQDARQPRPVMEANVQADNKTRKRTEGTATAVQAIHPDPMCSTSFGGDFIGPPAFPCSRDNALVGNGAAAPKSYLSPLEMRSPIAGGGLLRASESSTTMWITFYQPRLRFCPTEETHSKKMST